jgi:hypothetical protein
MLHKAFPAALATILGVICLSPISLLATPSQDFEAKLGKRPPGYELGSINFVEALVRVSCDFQIPLGIAWINAPKEKEKVPFAWKQATVQEIIQSIVGSDPNYQVQFKNGVIRVFPAGTIPDAQNFLQLKIKQFDVVDSNIDLALLKVRALINPAKQVGFSVGGEPNEPKITLRLKDSTIADILDAMVLASPRRIWIVVFSSDTNPTAAGFRRTAVLWDGLSAVSEKNEPALNLLRWGDKIPWPTAVAK